MKECDHTSAGMLVWQNNQLLLIERRRPPFGFAPPAGHIDGDNTFEEAANRELFEEVGLKVKNLKLLVRGRKENKCRRLDGDWHFWKIYEVDAGGNLKRSIEETKQVGWYGKEEIIRLAKKTEKYLNNKVNEAEWQKSPGLEPVWYEWFKKLKII